MTHASKPAVCRNLFTAVKDGSEVDMWEIRLQRNIKMFRKFLKGIVLIMFIIFMAPLAHASETNAGGDDDFETVTISALRGQITF